MSGYCHNVDFLRDFVVLFESLAKMIQVSITNVLDGKVVNNECKHDGAPFVAPDPGGGGCLVVVKFGKAFLEEFVGKDACLGETVHATAHFEVDPGVAGNLVELVLVDEFLGDVRKLDADILWLVEQGVQIKVFEVHSGKPGVTLGENTVDKQFDEFNQARGGTYISEIRDVVSANGDACAVSIVSLLWSDLANDLGEGDFSLAVRWDLVVGNGEEGVGAFDAFAFIRTGANALA